MLVVWVRPFRGATCPGRLAPLSWGDLPRSSAVVLVVRPRSFALEDGLGRPPYISRGATCLGRQHVILIWGDDPELSMPLVGEWRHSRGKDGLGRPPYVACEDDWGKSRQTTHHTETRAVEVVAGPEIVA